MSENKVKDAVINDIYFRIYLKFDLCCQSSLKFSLISCLVYRKSKGLVSEIGRWKSFKANIFFRLPFLWWNILQYSFHYLARSEALTFKIIFYSDTPLDTEKLRGIISLQLRIKLFTQIKCCNLIGGSKDHSANGSSSSRKSHFEQCQFHLVFQLLPSSYFN